MGTMLFLLIICKHANKDVLKQQICCYRYEALVQSCSSPQKLLSFSSVLYRPTRPTRCFLSGLRLTVICWCVALLTTHVQIYCGSC